MKRLIVLLLFVVCCAAPAQGTLLLYDGFTPVSPDTGGTYNYRPGEPLAASPDPNAGNPNGQLNVAANLNWRYAGAGTDAPKIGSGSLTVPGLLASQGNSVAFDFTKAGTSRIAIPTGPFTTGTVYWSAAMQLSAVNTLTTGASGLLAAAFNNSTGPGTAPTVVGGSLKLKKDISDVSGNSYFVGTGVNNTTANLVFTTTPLTAGSNTVFIVLSYTFNPSTSDDVVNMWVNPSSADFGSGSAPAPTLTATGVGGGGAEPTQIASFNIRNVSTVGAPSVVFDELRIGTTWADVTPAAVPETGSFMLLLAAGGLVAGRKKFVLPVLSRLASASKAL